MTAAKACSKSVIRTPASMNGVGLLDDAVNEVLGSDDIWKETKLPKSVSFFHGQVYDLVFGV